MAQGTVVVKVAVVDEVLVLSGFGGNLRRGAVVNITPKQIVVRPLGSGGSGIRFWRESGDAVGSGGGYDSTSLVAPTPERLQKTMFREAIDTLGAATFAALPMDDAIELARIYREMRARARGIKAGQ